MSLSLILVPFVDLFDFILLVCQTLYFLLESRLLLLEGLDLFILVFEFILLFLNLLVGLVS